MSKLVRVFILTFMVAALVIVLGGASVIEAAPSTVILRVNAGGSELSGTPPWQTDTQAPSTYPGTEYDPLTGPVDTSGLPSYVPEALFDDHAFSHDETLSYEFGGIAPGTEVQVNLFFVEVYPAYITGDPEHRRVFDVLLEGELAVDNLEVYEEVGGYKALEISRTVTVNDGALNIDFTRAHDVFEYTGSPMVAGIELIDLSAPAAPTATPSPDPDTGELPVEPTPANVEIDLHDGSLNSKQPGRPIAIYDKDGQFEIYGIDINTGNGSLAFTLTDDEIEAAGVPTDVPVILAMGENPYTFWPIVVYRLPTGEIQINTMYWDGKEYIVTWTPGDTAVDVVNW